METRRVEVVQRSEASKEPNQAGHLSQTCKIGITQPEEPSLGGVISDNITPLLLVTVLRELPYLARLSAIPFASL